LAAPGAAAGAAGAAVDAGAAVGDAGAAGAAVGGGGAAAGDAGASQTDASTVRAALQAQGPFGAGMAGCEAREPPPDQKGRKAWGVAEGRRLTCGRPAIRLGYIFGALCTASAAPHIPGS